MRTPERYISRVTAGLSAEAAAEVLTPIGRRQEALELALRTSSGVPASALRDVDVLRERGLVTVTGDRAVLTPEGRLLANEVAVRLHAWP